MAGYADGLIDGLVVFLCKHPAEIPVAHGLDGNLYIYEVPSWVFRKSGGWRRYDNATELVIPAELWKEVRFLGRSKKEEQFRRLADKFFSSNLMRDLSGNRPSKHSKNSITDDERNARRRARLTLMEAFSKR